MFKIIIILAFLPFFNYAQKAIVAENIHTPLGIPLNLSTLFGDICPNHLHMGLDFRTNGVEGIPIYSIREGYISRIRISRGGYGRVLYANHANGQTSVYAHCSIFSKEIDSMVTSWLINREQNEIDTLLSSEAIPIARGELIAFSGNSGSSTGPHLHFEIRETASEIALNPLDHGFTLIDDTAPIIESIKLVPISQEGFEIGSSSIAVTPSLLGSTSGQLAPQISLSTLDFSNNNGFGIMIRGGDRMKINGNKFDFYKTQVFFDSTLVFQSVMDSISFDHTRYVNDYCDYKAYSSGKTKWHKLFHSEGNPLSIYKVNKIQESIVSFSTKKTLVKLVVSDKNNFSSTYCFWLLPFPIDYQQVLFDTLSYFLPKNNIFSKYKNFQFQLEPFTLMQPVKKNNLLNSKIPLSKAASVIVPLPNQDPEKSYIKIGGKYSKSRIESGKLITETKTLGIPSLTWDTLAPKITALSYNSNDTTCSQKTLKWKISDQQSEIGEYFLYINDEFTPVYFDLKSNTISTSSTSISKGKIQVILVVKDIFGNEAIHKQLLTLF
jgi:hypothetical protein